MTASQEITPHRLRERLRYEPSTGKLFWRDHPDLARWNRRLVGREALASNCKGYRRGVFDGHEMSAHRAIFAMMHGYWPEIVDHINGDKSDNRLCNLRDVGSRDSNRNVSRYSCNSSGITGVTRCGRKWVAYISGDHGQIRLGYFYCIANAIRVRKEAEVAYGYHPNHGRVTQPTARAS